MTTMLAMGTIPVFDWAQVKVAHSFLAALPADQERSKHEMVQQLALAGGVAVEWNESGHVSLEGAWSCILQAQMVFSRYLKSLEVVSGPADAATAAEKTPVIVNSLPQDSQKRTIKSHHCSLKIKRMKKEVGAVAIKTEVNSLEENEVYVNITLSSLLPFSGLNSETAGQKPGIPVARDYNNRTESVLGLQSSYEVKHSESKLGVNECNCIEKNSSDAQITTDVSKNVNEPQGMLCDDKCALIEDVSTSETEHRQTMCAMNEQVADSRPGDRDATDKVTQAGQYLKGDVQVISNVNSAEMLSGTQHPDKYKGDRMCTRTQQTTTADICSASQESATQGKASPVSDNISSNSLQVGPFNKNENVKPVESNTKKKKNYEELTPFKFFCSLCSFKSKRESHYQRHLQLHNQVSQLFACDKCNFTTIRLGHLRRHELSHSSSSLACNVCHYRTNNHKFLAKHKRIKHNAIQVNEGVKEMLHCTHCEYTTSKNHFLQRHLRVHGSSSSNKAQHSYQCNQCSYKTSRREHLVRHTSNVHGGHRPFLCHHCGKAFKRQDALKQHATTHMTQATVMCPVCGKGCRSQAYLTQHLAVHSTVRSFLCELCGSAFKTRAVQRKHVLTIHQHPKAFFCHHCSRKFNTKYALRRHIKQHSTEKKIKSEDRLTSREANAPVTIPDMFGGSMRMLQADAIFIQDTARNQLPENTTAIAVQESAGPHNGEKITVQLAENYDPETLRVIPSHSFVQHSNETATALLYLTGSFTPY